LSSGDVINWPRHPILDPNNTQMATMSRWLDPLDDAMPMLLTAGNHDTAAVCPGGSACPNPPGPVAAVGIRDLTDWNQHFPPARFGCEGTYQPGRSENCWRTFNAAGKNWLVLSFELWPRWEVINWMEQVVASHPNHNVILLSHEILNGDGTLSRSNGGYGANPPSAVWSELDDYPNVVMMFSGHVGAVANSALTGVDGHKVATSLQCFHEPTFNPTRIVTVNTTTGTISTRIVANYDRNRSANVDYEYTQYRATISGMRFVS